MLTGASCLRTSQTRPPAMRRVVQTCRLLTHPISLWVSGPKHTTGTPVYLMLPRSQKQRPYREHSPRMYCTSHYQEGRGDDAHAFDNDHTQKAFKEVQALQQILRDASEAYYNRAEPVLGDETYDSLKQQLQQKEGRLLALLGAAAVQAALSNSPMFALSVQQPNKIRKITHETPWVLVSSVNDKAALHDRLEQMAGEGLNLDQVGWVVKPMVDGVSVRVRYRDGHLVQVVTRGDGRVGDDVTHNAAIVRGLPLQLWCTQNKHSKVPRGNALLKGKLDVCGNIYITDANFNEVKRLEPNLNNTGSTALQSLLLLDSSVARNRRLSFMADGCVYDPEEVITGDEKSLPNTQWERLQWLNAHGFAVSQNGTYHTHHTTALAAMESCKAQCSSLGYPILGVLMQANKTEPLHHWTTAWTFPSMRTVTRIQAIVIHVGRDGRVVPVAEVEPIEIDGVDISCITLDSVGVVLAMDMRVGDSIVIESNRTQQVAAVLKELRHGLEVPWSAPSLCPSCASVLRSVTCMGYKQCYCTSKHCGGDLLRHLTNFAVKAGLSRIGKVTVEKLMGSGKVAQIPDFFTLTEDDLQQVFNQKRAQQLYCTLQENKFLSLDKFLSGLGIRCIGKQTSAKLAARFSSVRAVQAATTTDVLKSAVRVGAAQDSLRAWFQEEMNQKMLDECAGAGVTCVEGITRTCITSV